MQVSCKYVILMQLPNFAQPKFDDTNDFTLPQSMVMHHMYSHLNWHTYPWEGHDTCGPGLNNYQQSMQ